MSGNADNFRIAAIYDGSQISTGIQQLSQLEAKIQQLNTSMGKIQSPKISPTVNSAELERGMYGLFGTMDHYTIASGEKLGAGVTSGMNKGLSGINASLAKAESQVVASMGRMQQSMLMAAGPFGQMASAAGPYGIAAAAIVGGAVMAERAAEKWEEANRKVANALRIDIKGSDMAKLMEQFQASRMETGIGADVITGAAAGAAGRVGKNQLAGATESIAIYASKWKADSSVIASEMTNLGTSMKSQSEDWTTFIDKNGAAIDSLAKKYNKNGADILSSVNRMSPGLARLGIGEDQLPQIEALIASGQSWALGDRLPKMLNVTIASMQGKASVDLAKLLKIDTAEFEKQLSTDAVGTIERVAAAMAALPDHGAELMAKLGPGKDLFAILGDPAKLKELADNLELANSAFGSGKTALGAYGSKLDTSAGQMERFGQIWAVTMEVIGKPLIGAAATGLEALNDTLIGMGTTLHQAADGFNDLYAAAAHFDLNKTVSQIQAQAATKQGFKPDWQLTPTELAEKKAREFKPDTSTPNWFNVTDASALGSKSGNSFIDSLNSTMGTGLPKSISDAYLKSAGISSQAGKDAAEAWGAKFTAYVEANVSPRIAALLASGLSNAQALSVINSQTESSSFYKDRLKDLSPIPSMSGDLMQMGRYELSESGTDKAARFDILKDGELIATESVNLMEETVAEARKRISAKYSEMVLSWPNIIKSSKDAVGNAIADVWSDGRLKWEEKGDLQKMLDGLNAQMANAPFELKPDYQYLINQTEQAIKGIDGTVKIKVDTGEAEANFGIWLQDKADEFVKIADVTGKTPTRGEQLKRQEFELKASPRTLELLDLIDKAVTSGDVGQISDIPLYKAELEQKNPGISDTGWFKELMQTATKEFRDQVTIVNGTIKVIDSSGKSVSTTFMDAAFAAGILAGSLNAASASITTAVAQIGMVGTYLGKQVTSAYQGSFKTFTSPTFAQAKAPAATGLSYGTIDKPKFATTKTGLSGFDGDFLSKLPKLATGGKVTKGGLLVAGEEETEWVIPESDIKGLYPPSASVDKNSMSYLTGGKYFDDYQHKVSAQSYMRSSFPNAPPIVTTGNQPVSWLSDKQTTGNEAISGEIRAAQLRAMGLTEDNVLKSPKVAAPLTNRDMWNAIYDNSGTCIAFVEPDPSLNFTPGKNYMPGGSGFGNMDKEVSGGITTIARNTATTAAELRSIKSIFDDGNPFGNPSKKPGDALTVGSMPTTASSLSNWSAWNAIYDNNGTCVAFVEPDPSLNFKPNPDYQEGGYRLGNMGGGPTSLGDAEIQTWDPVVRDAMMEANALSDQANKDAAKTAQNTERLATSMATVEGALTTGSSGSSGGVGSSSPAGFANRGGGQYFGGTSVNGGGSWIGGGSTNPNGGGWGVAASNAAAGSWGGAIGSGWGSAMWAEGGISYGQTSLTPGGNIFAEKPGLVEAFIPISDRSAGLRILPQVMDALGVRRFASGGIVGSPSSSGGIKAAAPIINATYNINGSGLSESQLKRVMRDNNNELLRTVERKFYEKR